MEKSESIKELATALAKFQAVVSKINLDKEVEVQTRTNSTYKFKYATLSNIIESIRKPLSENGLSYTQLINQDGGVTTLLMHTSGEWIGSTLVISGEKSPQGVGSAITYAKRYALSSILGLCADDDDDANSAQGNNVISQQDKQKNTHPQKRAFTNDMICERMFRWMIVAEAKFKAENPKKPFSFHGLLERSYIISAEQIKLLLDGLTKYEEERKKQTT